MLEQALADAEAQPLCDAADAGATPEVQTIDCPVAFDSSSNPGYLSVTACDAITKMTFAGMDQQSFLDNAALYPLQGVGFVMYVVYAGEQGEQ